MIAISDNTAADHLIHLLGREAVEAHQSAMGHTQPELNVPFLTTRELFFMKLVLDASERHAYASARVSEKRRLLDQVYATAEPPDDLDQRIASWSAPRDVDTIEWFASASDVCRAFAALQDAGQAPAGKRALQTLAINPGIDIDRAAFRYVGFKGGSEPGVLTTSWLLQRESDAAWRVVTLLAADPAQDVPLLPVLYLAQAAILLAGR
jgi:hypothetical protein